MNEIGKVLFLVGILFMIAGALFWLGLGRFVGRLPGDILIQRGNSSFYFPITTCVLVSLLLSALLWFLRK